MINKLTITSYFMLLMFSLRAPGPSHNDAFPVNTCVLIIKTGEGFMIKVQDQQIRSVNIKAVISEM